MIADCSCSYVDATDIHINTCNSSGCISRFDLSDDFSNPYKVYEELF